MAISNKFRLENRDIIDNLPFSSAEISRRSLVDAATCRKFFNGEIVSRVSQAKIVAGLKKLSKGKGLSKELSLTILNVQEGTKRIINFALEDIS